MNDGELLMQHLRAARAAADALVRIVDLIEEQAHRMEANTDSSEPTECVHPMAARVGIPTMGHASRFVCRVCQQQVEG